MSQPSEKEPSSNLRSPMQVPMFRALFLAASVSYVGTWIQDVGQGWLMTTLTTSPFLVSLVSASLSLPGLVLALPAGVLADLVDRRRLLLGTQSFLALVAGVLGVAAMTGRATPPVVLLCTLGMGIGTALTSPAWQAVLPEIVPRELLGRAIVWNGVAWNAARALGPALGGLLVAAYGPPVSFVANAISFVVPIVVLYRYRQPQRVPIGPPERFSSAIVAGIRFARHSTELRAVLGRAGFFALFGTTTLALLPLIARHQLGGSPFQYGALLGCMGLGAICGAALRSPLQRKLGGPILMPVGMALLSIAVAVMSQANTLRIWGPMLIVFGFGWLLALSTLNTAAQLALPVWVRARGLGIYLLVFSGAMAAGSALSGKLAAVFGISTALSVSAVGLALGTAVSALAPLPDEGQAKDLTLHAWSEAPRIPGEFRGPVIVMLRFPLGKNVDRAAARAAVRALAAIRLRDGATQWRLYEDAEEPEVLVEVFAVSSWEEHLRQHHRGTVADRQIFERAAHACGGGPPLVIHLVAAP